MHSRFITSFSFPWSHQTKCCFCQFRCFEYPVQTESNLHPIWISNHDFFETPPLHLFIRDLLGVFLSNGTRGVSPPTSLHVSVAATLQWLFCLVSNWDFKLKEAWVELRSLWWGREWKWETLGVLKSYAPLLTQCHCRCVSKNNSENHKLMDSEWSSFWNREKHNCDLWVFGKHATHPIVTLSLNLLKMPTLTIKCSKDEKHTTLPKLTL